MSEPLEKLAEKTKAENRRNGGFSRRLGEIVNRYEIIDELTELPDFTDIEKQILSEIICGSTIDTRKIRGLHLDVLDAATGTVKEKQALSKKLEALQAAQRLKVIEELGQ